MKFLRMSMRAGFQQIRKLRILRGLLKPSTVKCNRKCHRVYPVLRLVAEGEWIRHLAYDFMKALYPGPICLCRAAFVANICDLRHEGRCESGPVHTWNSRWHPQVHISRMRLYELHPVQSHSFRLAVRPILLIAQRSDSALCIPVCLTHSCG